MLKTKFLYIAMGAALYLGWAGQQAYGVAMFNPSQAELALLPPYCATVAGPAGQRKMGPEARRWLEILGNEYYDIHHYCDALLHWNAAQRIFDNSKKRSFDLQTALDGIEYVESRARPEFILNAEMAYMKGRVLSALGRKPEAVVSFQRSIQFQPKYTPPYAALADYYISVGQKTEAKKILTEGLKQAPKTEDLTRRLGKLQ